MKDNNLLYIITFAIALIVILVVTFLLIKKGGSSKLKRKLQELERQRNLIVSTPIMSELAKIEVVLKNDKLENKYEEWLERYETIKSERYDKVTNMLIEVDNLIYEKAMKQAKSAIVTLEMEIYKLRVSTDNLLEEIREITMSEERNRAIITKLKSKFRELQKILQTSTAKYDTMSKYIELQFENIEKKFQDFEEIMENNEYSEVVSLVKVLDEMIAHMAVVIDEVPDIILLTDKILPARIEEINEAYQKLVKKGYPLDYLQVPYNLEQIEKKIKAIIDKVKILNLEDSMFELKTFLDYLDNLLNDFDIEKRNKKIFDEIANEFKLKITKVNKIVSDIYIQLDDIKNLYNLTETDLEDLEKVNKKLLKANLAYNVIVKNLKQKKESYSKLKENIEELSIGFENIEDELNLCLKSLGSMHDDELRAREQLDEITDLLKKCRAKIRSYSLPIISNNYFVELAEANEAIYEIVKELEKTPITIKTLNIRVDTARDLSLKLFNTTNEMIKTAKLSEMTIVYGNRYKPLKKEIEQGLDEATKIFFKGNYKKALETAINTINIIEPDIYKKMMSIYKNEKI